MNRFQGRRPLVVSLLVIALLAVGCGGGGAGRNGGGGSSPGANQDIREVIETFLRHYRNKDSQAIAAMFTEPSKITFAGATNERSRADVREAYDHAFNIVTTIYSMELISLEITRSSSKATVQMTWEQDVFNSALGKRVVAQVDVDWELTNIGGKLYVSHVYEWAGSRGGP